MFGSAGTAREGLPGCDCAEAGRTAPLVLRGSQVVPAPPCAEASCMARSPATRDRGGEGEWLRIACHLLASARRLGA